MRSILQKKSLRFVFGANVVSMIGSGMNTAAVAWYILQATHSTIALGTFAVVQTLPAILLLPFTGVIIDREDRRRLVMMLDGGRALVILVVAILAFSGKVKVWELYAMNALVAAGFWMFWPTITALIQELTPEDEFVHANTFLLAGVQGGWLIAGSIVGFVYNKIGLGGVLLADCSTYAVSFLCYLAVRKGRHVVPRPLELHADIIAVENALQKFFRELHEGLQFLRQRPALVMLGLSWALFLSAMMQESWRKARDRHLARSSRRDDDRCAAGSVLHRRSCGLRAHGLRTRHHRRRHEYQPDGADPAALHGTRAEHFLRRRNFAAGVAVISGRRGRAMEPGGGIFCHWDRLCHRLHQRDVAGAYSPACSCARGLAEANTPAPGAPFFRVLCERVGDPILRQWPQ